MCCGMYRLMGRFPKMYRLMGRFPKMYRLVGRFPHPLLTFRFSKLEQNVSNECGQIRKTET